MTVIGKVQTRDRDGVVAVLEELAVGIVERLVLALALVLPGELALPPDVGEAAVALGPGGGGAGDVDALFKSVFGAGMYR